MSQPDLFVVCKNCQAEVSPYVTECPYCGTRVRKRAPKIERPDAQPVKPARRGSRGTGGPSRSKAKPRSTPRGKPAKAGLGRLRSGEIPGIRGDETGKPWATIVLVAMSFGIWLSLAFYTNADLALNTLSADPWLYLTASLVNDGTAAQFAVVVGLGLYGMLLERRYGPLAIVGLFLLCGPGALAVAVAIDPGTFVFGSNGAALGFLCAWVVPVLLARQRSDEDDDADLLGTLVIAIVLLLVPVLSQGSWLAGVTGGVLGAVVGLVLASVRR